MKRGPIPNNHIEDGEVNEGPPVQSSNESPRPLASVVSRPRDRPYSPPIPERHRSASGSYHPPPRGWEGERSPPPHWRGGGQRDFTYREPEPDHFPPNDYRPPVDYRANSGGGRREYEYREYEYVPTAVVFPGVPYDYYPPGGMPPQSRDGPPPLPPQGYSNNDRDRERDRERERERYANNSTRIMPQVPIPARSFSTSIIDDQQRRPRYEQQLPPQGVDRAVERGGNERGGGNGGRSSQPISRRESFHDLSGPGPAQFPSQRQDEGNSSGRTPAHNPASAAVVPPPFLPGHAQHVPPPNPPPPAPGMMRGFQSAGQAQTVSNIINKLSVAPPPPVPPFPIPAVAKRSQTTTGLPSAHPPVLASSSNAAALASGRKILPQYGQLQGQALSSGKVSSFEQFTAQQLQGVKAFMQQAAPGPVVKGAVSTFGITQQQPKTPTTAAIAAAIAKDKLKQQQLLQQELQSAAMSTASKEERERIEKERQAEKERRSALKLAAIRSSSLSGLPPKHAKPQSTQQGQNVQTQQSTQNSGSGNMLKNIDHSVLQSIQQAMMQQQGVGGSTEGAAAAGATEEGGGVANDQVLKRPRVAWGAGLMRQTSATLPSAAEDAAAAAAAAVPAATVVKDETPLSPKPQQQQHGRSSMTLPSPAKVYSSVAKAAEAQRQSSSSQHQDEAELVDLPTKHPQSEEGASDSRAESRLERDSVISPDFVIGPDGQPIVKKKRGRPFSKNKPPTPGLTMMSSERSMTPAAAVAADDDKSNNNKSNDASPEQSQASHQGQHAQQQQTPVVRRGGPGRGRGRGRGAGRNSASIAASNTSSASREEVHSNRGVVYTPATQSHSNAASSRKAGAAGVPLSLVSTKRLEKERQTLGYVFGQGVTSEKDIRRAFNYIGMIYELQKMALDSSNAKAVKEFGLAYQPYADVADLKGAARFPIPKASEICHAIDQIDGHVEYYFNVLKACREKQFMTESTIKDLELPPPLVAPAAAPSVATSASTTSATMPPPAALSRSTSISVANISTPRDRSDSVDSTASAVYASLTNAMNNSNHGTNASSAPSHGPTSVLMQTISKRNKFFNRLTTEMKQKHVEIANSNHLRVVEAHLFTTIVPQADEMKKLTYPVYQRPMTQRASNTGSNKNTYITSSGSKPVGESASTTASAKKDAKKEENEAFAPPTAAASTATVANVQHATLPSISETVSAYMSLAPSIHPLGTPYHPSVTRRNETHRANRMIIMHHVKHVHMSRRGAWEMLGSHYRSVYHKWSAHIKAVERQEEIQAQREGPKLRGSIPSFMSMRTFDTPNVPRAVSRLVLSQGTQQGAVGGVGGVARSDYEQEQMINEMMAREKRLQRIEQGPCRVPSMRSPWLFTTCLSDRTHAKLKLPRWPEELRLIIEEESSDDESEDESNDDSEEESESDEEGEESENEVDEAEINVDDKKDEEVDTQQADKTEPQAAGEGNDATKMDVDDDNNAKPAVSPTKKAKPSSPTKMKKPVKVTKKSAKSTKSSKSSKKSASKTQKKRKAETPVEEVKEVALVNVLPSFPMSGEEVDFVDNKCHRLTTDGRRQLCGGYAAHIPCPPNCNCALQVERINSFAHLWTDLEKNIFLDKFLQFPKNFYKIASFLPNKSTKDCIAFYYDGKSSLEWKSLLKEFDNRRKQVKGNWQIAMKSSHLVNSAVYPPTNVEIKDILVDLPMQDMTFDTFSLQPPHLRRTFALPISRLFHRVSLDSSYSGFTQGNQGLFTQVYPRPKIAEAALRKRMQNLLDYDDDIQRMLASSHHRQLDVKDDELEQPFQEDVEEVLYPHRFVSVAQAQQQPLGPYYQYHSHPMVLQEHLSGLYSYQAQQGQGLQGQGQQLRSFVHLLPYGYSYSESREADLNLPISAHENHAMPQQQASAPAATGGRGRGGGRWGTGGGAGRGRGRGRSAANGAQQAAVLGLTSSNNIAAMAAAAGGFSTTAPATEGDQSQGQGLGSVITAAAAAAALTAAQQMALKRSSTSLPSTMTTAISSMVTVPMVTAGGRGRGRGRGGRGTTAANSLYGNITGVKRAKSPSSTLPSSLPHAQSAPKVAKVETSTGDIIAVRIQPQVQPQQQSSPPQVHKENADILPDLDLEGEDDHDSAMDFILNYDPTISAGGDAADSAVGLDEGVKEEELKAAVAAPALTAAVPMATITTMTTETVASVKTTAHSDPVVDTTAIIVEEEGVVEEQAPVPQTELIASTMVSETLHHPQAPPKEPALEEMEMDIVDDDDGNEEDAQTLDHSPASAFARFERAHENQTQRQEEEEVAVQAVADEEKIEDEIEAGAMDTSN